MLADLRHACRSILRMPIVSTVVVVSLAIGIGVNTVVFSWIQARILDPVPGVKDGRQLLLIEPKTEAGLYAGTSWPEFKDLRDTLQSFDGLIAARMAPLYVGPAGSVERLFGLLVSDNYFSALGVRPALGRFFAPDEVLHAGGAPVAVISHRLWQSHFRGAPDVIGHTVRINGRELTVIGVTPDEFQGTTVGLQFDAWLPATLAPVVATGSTEIENRGVRGYGVIGRLKASASRRQAQEEFSMVMRQLAGAYPETNAKVTGEVLTFTDSPRGPQRMLNTALAVLQGIMLLLLLAVCGNVANLMLARASARQKEMGVRLALGARPWRVASLLLTENVVLAVLGAALGAACAIWGTQGLLVLPLTGLPIRFQTSIDGVGLAFAMCLGVGCGLLAGAAPAMQLSRVEPQQAFRAGVASAGRSGLRHALMGVQVALAMIVLLVAGLFFRSVSETRDTDPGFRRDGVLLAAYDLAGRSSDATVSRALAVRTLDALRALPSVESVAIASSVPLDIHGLPSRVFTVDGHSRADGGFDEALTNIVTPGYFGVMDIERLAGRDFAVLTDTTAPRQAIVNEEFVRRYVQNGEPLGRQIRARGGPFTITGVVRNSLYNAFGEPPTPAIYFSYKDTPQPRGEIHVRFRPGSESTGAADVRRVMRELDPDLPVFNLRSMTQHVDTNLIFRTIPARMFSVLGPLLLVLAAVGIYAVVAYSVSLRTREVGVRVALGATSQRVVRQFVGESLSVALVGGLLGWSVAFLVATQFAPGGRIDAVVFAIVPLLLLTVAAIAAWVPAQRTVAIDPSAALRGD
jgi:predicted permease